MINKLYFSSIITVALVFVSVLYIFCFINVYCLITSCQIILLQLKNHVYYPKEKGQVLTYGTYEISLHSVKEKNGFVERMINITHSKVYYFIFYLLVILI